MFNRLQDQEYICINLNFNKKFDELWLSQFFNWHLNMFIILETNKNI